MDFKFSRGSGRRPRRSAKPQQAEPYELPFVSQVEFDLGANEDPRAVRLQLAEKAINSMLYFIKRGDIEALQSLTGFFEVARDRVAGKGGAT